MTTRIQTLLLAACVAGASGIRSSAQQAPAALRASATDAQALRGIRPTPPVRVRLWLADRQDMDTALVGVADDRVAYANPDTPTLVQGVLELAVIQRGFFTLTLDHGELAQAERQRDWVKVYRMLHAALTPTLPYLALPDNNAAEQVMQMAMIMMRIATTTERAATTDEQRQRLQQQYEAAYGVFQHLARATWSPIGNLAVIRGSQALVRMDRPKTAQFYLDEMLEPMPGDAAYGSYWLVRGLLAAHQGETQNAMQAAILSVAFENKDIETFPDALLLSAQCYEELQEWHRARDIYFEVASLFPNTDWADDAAGRLEFILDKGLTETKEEVSVEIVFLGIDEDINELARDLLESRSQEARAAADPPARRTPPP